MELQPKRKGGTRDTNTTHIFFLVKLQLVGTIHNKLIIYLIISSSLVFSPKAGFGRNQSPVRRPVWLWHTAF